MEQRQLTFPPFQLDRVNERVWHSTAQGTSALRLRPKTFAVLCYLVDRAQQLVTKAQLLDALWTETCVSDSALKSCVRELRAALGDDPKAPQFIETIHRRGYRFIAEVISSQQEEANQKAKGKNQKAKVEDLPPAPSTQYPAPTLVGRETELTQLHSWLDKALDGERQMVFVAGEAGIGKTTLIEAFQQRLETGDWRLGSSPQASRLQPLGSPVWLGRGQCIEHHGLGEPYMPVLEALGRLCRGSDGQRLKTLLSQYAPTWLVQMSALLSASELSALRAKVRGATQARMLREMAEAVEVLTNERPLLLILEDLHWSDYSTVALLSLLARRREPARS